MPKYHTTVDRWISHECRLVKAGQDFEAEFPKGPDGKEIKLSDTLRLVTEKKGKAKASPDEGGGGEGEGLV
jgi:hypothetical protein